MRILVLSPQPFFSPRGTPLSVYYRTLILSELGHQIDVLTYGQGEDVDLPGVRIIRIPRFRWLGPIPVGPSLLKFFLDGFLTVWMLGLLIRNRYDAIDAHEESVFHCLLFQPFFKFGLIYDMHSSLPQQLTNFHYTRSKVLIGLFEKLEKRSLIRADAVIAISPTVAEYARSLMPDPAKLFLIENSIHEEVHLKSPVDHGPVIDRWLEGIPQNRTLICYAGTFEPYQGLDLLLSAFAEVRRERPETFLVLVGGNKSQVETARRHARELAIESHCLFTGSQPHTVARALMDRSHVLVSPRKVGSNTPLKVYEMMASGRPIVATRIEAHTQVLSDEICFLTAPEPIPLARALLEILGDPEIASQKVRAAREVYDKNYSRDRYIDKMKALLGSLE